MTLSHSKISVRGNSSSNSCNNCECRIKYLQDKTKWTAFRSRHELKGKNVNECNDTKVTVTMHRFDPGVWEKKGDGHLNQFCSYKTT